MRVRYELPCPDNGRDECKYAPECPIPTVHHLVPRRVGKAAVSEALANGEPEYAHLIKRFINSWYNKAKVGRCLHDFLDTMPEELPNRQMMERIVGSSNMEDFRNGTEA